MSKFNSYHFRRQRMHRQQRRKRQRDIVAPKIRNISASENVGPFDFGTYSMFELTGPEVPELVKPLLSLNGI